MQREPNDINHQFYTEKELNEMEERRVERLHEAGIDEHEVLQRASKNLGVWTSYFGENITRGKADSNFVLKDQWLANERAEFERLFKPPMTFNMLYDVIKKVVGEQRRNKPDLIVRSLNGKVKQEQLDVRGDLIRTFCYQSQTDLVYQTAFKSALTMGYGAFQVMLDYESARSFNRTIRFELIADCTRCAWDPTAIKPHKGDGNFCCRNFTMTRDEFFATYPYVNNPVSFVDPYMLLDFQSQTKDTICIEDQYVKEWYPITMMLLSNGMSVSEEEWKDAQKMYQEQQDLVQGSIISRIVQNGIPKVISSRQTQDYKIMHYRMIRDYILDFSEWPSKQLPILFVDGDSYYMEGQQYTKSLIHEAKDAQRCINYFNSEIAAEIKNRRREQWLGTVDNIKGYEQIWRNPEVQIGMLPAQPDPKTGQMPTKMPGWDISQGIMLNAQKSVQDLQKIIGFSEQEELLGRDQSGKARRERKLESGMATYVYFDNLNQAIEQAGRIINDLLPHIVGYDERHMTISKPDGKTTSVIFNHQQKDGSVKNVLEDGDFDVEIDTGPSFAVQKEVALEFLQQTLAAFPQAFPLVADLWAKNLDVQFMPQMVERLQTLVPPNILAKENGQPPPPPQPDPQQMMMQQQMQMQQQEMQFKQQELQQKGAQLQIDAQQHQMDQVRLQNDAYEMLAKIQNEKDKNSIQKQKLVADLLKIITDSNHSDKDRGVDLHKHSLDHSAKLIDLMNNLNQSPKNGEN